MSVDFEKAINEFATPFYIFDTDQLEKQISKIKHAVGDKIKICYAIKANPFIIKAAEPFVDNFEVCSPGEFKICEKLEIEPEKIILSGVYKNREDIDYVIKTYGNRILYTAESLSQWALLHELANKYNVRIDCLLRLTSGNQFGMDSSVIHEILPQESLVKIKGIHFFSGTQKKAPAKYERELSMIKAFCEDLMEKYQIEVSDIEYGPGLPATYFEDEKDSESVMLDALAEYLGHFDYAGRITLEIGRFIAASCGSYVSAVVDKKVNEGANYCIIDGGIHHVNYYGQMMAMKKPSIKKIPSGDQSHVNSHEQEWTICGSLCTANDVLVKQFNLTDLKIGDRLIFNKVGAYSMTEGVSLLLSRDLPQVILYSDKTGFKLIRKNESTYTLNSSL